MTILDTILNTILSDDTEAEGAERPRIYETRWQSRKKERNTKNKNKTDKK